MLLLPKRIHLKISASGLGLDQTQFLTIHIMAVNIAILFVYTNMSNARLNNYALQLSSSSSIALLIITLITIKIIIISNHIPISTPPSKLLLTCQLAFDHPITCLLLSVGTALLSTLSSCRE